MPNVAPGDARATGLTGEQMRTFPSPAGELRMRSTTRAGEKPFRRRNASCHTATLDCFTGDSYSVSMTSLSNAVQTGLHYKIIVSEPWDYTNANGENIISGTVTDIVEDTCLIFVSDAPVILRKATGTTFVLFPRHKDDPRLFASIFNIGLLYTDYAKGMSISFLKDNSEFVIIGSLHKNR